MKKLPLVVRLIAAATSVTVTLLLLGTVVSIAEPQRSILIAKVQHSEQLPSAPLALAMATNGAAPASKPDSPSASALARIFCSFPISTGMAMPRCSAPSAAVRATSSSAATMATRRGPSG